MRVLGITASPRRHGNSETILDAALKGACSKGAVVQKIILNDMSVNPFTGSSACRKTGSCRIKDDAPSIIKSIKKADALIVASPVYFGSITAQLKALIDRCQSVWVKKEKRINKKKAIFISVSSSSRRKFFRNSQEIVNNFFAVMGFKPFKHIYAPNLERKGEAAEKKALIKKAFKYGAGL